MTDDDEQKQLYMRYASVHLATRDCTPKPLKTEIKEGNYHIFLQTRDARGPIDAYTYASWRNMNRREVVTCVTHDMAS